MRAPDEHLAARTSRSGGETDRGVQEIAAIDGPGGHIAEPARRADARRTVDAATGGRRPRAPGRAARDFDVYGLSIRLEGDWPEVVDAIGLDFTWFRRPPSERPPRVHVVVQRREPDFDAYAGATATFVTPRNVVYQQDGQTIVDYFGRALSILDRRSQRIVLQGQDPQLVHEAGYLFLLSRIGEYLDAQRLARLHAVGLAGATGAVAVLLPAGGGKSTLAVRALNSDGVKLLSDDSPILDRHGRLHPFPLRISVNPTDAASLPAAHVRRIERMEFHPKLALDLSAFTDRIESRALPLRHLVLGRRTLGREARLERVSRRAALAPLVRESIVGVGLYQGMEFVLQRGLRDLVGKVGDAGNRTACCAAVLANAQVWQATLGRDFDRNWSLLRPLLD